MKKSELIQKLIDIEEESAKADTTITMNYLYYLKKLKRLVEIGDVELNKENKQ